MTGSTSITPQVLGASTVAGVSLAALPTTGFNRIFEMILIGVVAIAIIIVVSRLVKVLATRKS